MVRIQFEKWILIFESTPTVNQSGLHKGASYEHFRAFFKTTGRRLFRRILVPLEEETLLYRYMVNKAKPFRLNRQRDRDRAGVQQYLIGMI